MIKFLFFSLLHFVINNFFLKINFLIDKKEASDHKKKVFTNIKTPLSGGIIFMICFPFIQIEQNFILLFTLLALYVTGFLSDINLLTSPIKRIIVQAFFILVFIIMCDLSIKTLSLEKLDEIFTATKNVAAEVIKLKGATVHAPGNAISSMIESVVQDKKQVIPVSTNLDGEYGQKDVSIGVPAVIGKNGVEKIVELELNDEEKEWFNKGIDSVKNALSGVEF